MPMPRPEPRRRLIIVVTGTPGAGKTYFSMRLAERLGRLGADYRVIELNDLVEKYSAYSGIDSMKARIVDGKGLNSALRKELLGARGSAIIVGHLATELKIRPDISVVVRVGLDKLATRLENRGYSIEKIRENLIAEAMDFCGLELAKASKETYEVETQKQKTLLLRYIASAVAGADAVKPKQERINKFRELLRLAENGNRYRL